MEFWLGNLEGTLEAEGNEMKILFDSFADSYLILQPELTLCF